MRIPLLEVAAVVFLREAIRPIQISDEAFTIPTLELDVDILILLRPAEHARIEVARLVIADEKAVRIDVAVSSAGRGAFGSEVHGREVEDRTVAAFGEERSSAGTVRGRDAGERLGIEAGGRVRQRFMKGWVYATVGRG